MATMAWQAQAGHWWTARNPRERMLLSVLGVLLAIVLGYLLVWQPAQKQLVRNKASIVRLGAEVATLEKLDAEARQLKRQPAAAPRKAAELQPLLQQMLAQHDLSGLTLAAEGDYGVTLSGEAVFDRWLQFAGELAAQQQVRLVRLQADAIGPGRVRLKALLVQGGGEV
ncbi:type II secretion system protein M [Neisseriaceae bacterium JH1-16]|nr:type II secretion system protein M [Neisseriaceae bacterium JH1-16]